MPRLHDILHTPSLNGVYRLSVPEDAPAMDRVPVLDGRTLGDKASLLIALGHALDLPDYFGANWDALEECLGDFSWRAGPIRLFLRHADAIPADLLDTLIDLFADTSAEWAGRGRVCSLFLSGLDRGELSEAT